MSTGSTLQLLSANTDGRRATIGLATAEELRALSDARALTCPGCGAVVILHAGSVRAHHFAHLPGAVCNLPQPEPETEEHRSGKLLLAEWARTALPSAEVIVEAFLPATNQRADVLVGARDEFGIERRIALEFQCANLSEREWKRRHELYRSNCIEDLWLLGGSRLQIVPPPAPTSIRTGELERAMLFAEAPLLFLSSIGLDAGSVIRFRPAKDAQVLRPEGRLSHRSLIELAFPWQLLDWPRPAEPIDLLALSADSSPPEGISPADWRVWQWLATRYQVTPESLNPFFGFALEHDRAFACSPALWQAAIYYRFIHRRVGDGWWMPEIEGWVKAQLPLTQPIASHGLRGALAEFQEILGAAGMLSLPVGYGRRSARVQADLTTLPKAPDAAEAQRIARYRRTLVREEREVYTAKRTER